MQLCMQINTRNMIRFFYKIHLGIYPRESYKMNRVA